MTASSTALPSPPRQTLALVVALAACLGVGALGGWATSTSVATWYQTLAKPSFNPPDWVFGPVWTTLYILMAIAAWLVWRAGAPRGVLALFAVQLALNLAWSFLFFGARQTGLAFADLVLMWLAIAATMVAFRRHSTVAALLLVPYLAWVSFAGLLNFTVWRLN